MQKQKSKIQMLFEYLKLNPVFTIRDLVIWTEEKPFCYNCGHSTVRNLKKHIQNKGYFISETRKDNYKVFKLEIDKRKKERVASYG